MTVRLDRDVTGGVSYDNNDKPVYKDSELDIKMKALSMKVGRIYTYIPDGMAVLRARSRPLSPIPEVCEKQPVSEK